MTRQVGHADLLGRASFEGQPGDFLGLEVEVTVTAQGQDTTPALVPG